MISKPKLQLVKQLLDSHRTLGEIEGKIPRSFIFIDEAKEIKDSRSIKLTLGYGRKYGLCAVLASQRDAEISDEAIRLKPLPKASLIVRLKSCYQWINLKLSGWLGDFGLRKTWWHSFSLLVALVRMGTGTQERSAESGKTTAGG
ncbi:MAG: hypothetical protein PUP92_28475 [Rhizonema sp. PD38]|nr:hypothetical protein [Rhizonema sp. PD38]